MLDGTDLLELGDLGRTDLPSQPGGPLRGGAGGLTAERRGAALISTDGSLTIQGTEEGVLVLELNSGNDSLPPDYWVHYLKAE